MTNKIAVLDVDGTLFDFHRPLHRLLHELYGTPVDLQKTWDWHKKYITDAEFYAAVHQIHEDQINSEPFVGAAELCDTLISVGYDIVIASHRRVGAAADLAAWITIKVTDKFAGIYAGPDKTFLITEGDLVIDDNPKTIEYAIGAGATSWTMMWPWNMATNARKFKNLDVMARMAKKL